MANRTLAAGHCLPRLPHPSERPRPSEILPRKPSICFTDYGKWDFDASNDKDAIRLALYYCWQDGEDFIKIEGHKGFIPYTLCLCKIDKSNLPTFEF